MSRNFESYCDHVTYMQKSRWILLIVNSRLVVRMSTVCFSFLIMSLLIAAPHTNHTTISTTTYKMYDSRTEKGNWSKNLEKFSELYEFVKTVIVTKYQCTQLVLVCVKMVLFILSLLFALIKLIIFMESVPERFTWNHFPWNKYLFNKIDDDRVLPCILHPCCVTVTPALNNTSLSPDTMSF